MIFRTKKSYKFFITFVSILSTLFVLYVFFHQISTAVLTLISITYAGILLLTIEAFFYFVQLENLFIKSPYFKLKLDDIIDIEYSEFGTKIRTRWKIYYLPPIERIEILKELIKNHKRHVLY